ncbi:MAG TPA: hypothetical protein VJH90_02550 [archaeon]|nr:hypothetical protein [archaeon]
MPKVNGGSVVLTTEELMSRTFKRETVYNSLDDCHPDSYNSRCRYNGMGEDFEKCPAWKAISTFSDRAKELGRESKKVLDDGRARSGMERIHWDPHDRVLCPVLEYKEKGAAYIFGTNEVMIVKPPVFEEG